MTELIKNNKRHPIYLKRKCLRCQLEFSPTASNQKFCSHECWYLFNKPLLREKHRAYYDIILRQKYGIKRRKDMNGFKSNIQLRKEILRILGNKCIRCGFSDWRALQIDHVKGNGRKEWLKFQNNLYQYYKNILEKIQRASKDYQILCANCNSIKRHENHEWNKNGNGEQK